MKFLYTFCFLLTVLHVSNGQNVRLFDGKSLKGWKVSDQAFSYLWKVEDGMIVGGDSKKKIPVNSYIVSEKSYKNFEFRCLFKLTGDPSTGMINSGIQYRSELKNGDMTGYQADIGEGYWGDIYDEHRRGKLVSGELGSLRELLNKDGWNSYIIRCSGNRHQLYINGVKTADYLEKDARMAQHGVFGVQIHSGGMAQIFLKDIELEELPE
jgi:hypothetical protein